MSGGFYAENGYALPLVMLAIALFLIYAGESSARAVREARVAKMKVNSEIAFYAAEAGFNRARARLVGGGTPEQMAQLNNLGQTLVQADGTAGGRYTLEVTALSELYGVYQVKSTGYFGEGTRYEARREVTGVVKLICPATSGPPRPVVTDYPPIGPYIPTDPGC